MCAKELLAKLLAISFVSGLLMGYFAVHQFSLPAEAALHLTESGLIASGAVPYLDFWDNAMPFVLYVDLVPVFISRLISIHPILLTNLCTIFLFALSAFLIALLSELTPSRRNLLKNHFWPIIFCFALVTVWQLEHFGQPDHLFFLIFCPYLCCRAGRARGLEVPKLLSLFLSVLLACASLSDPLYFFYWLVFEISSLLSFYPFVSGQFLLKRCFSLELRASIVAIVCLLLLWLALSPYSFAHYFTVVARINWCSYLMPLQSLSYFGLSTDFRFAIYGSAFCLILSFPAVASSVLTRMFALSSLLGLALMILQGGAFAFTNYLFVSFAAMALVSAISHYLRGRPGIFNKLSVQKFVFLDKLGVFASKTAGSVASILLIMLLAGSAAYAFELAKLPFADRYDLGQLGYLGFCDRRDLGVFSEIVEGNSRPNETVSILGLALRPAFPLLTQLRRKPGLFLTSGFPLDVLRTLELPMYSEELSGLQSFKKEVYERMRAQLASRSNAPHLVLMEEDEIRGIFDEYGLTPVLESNYNHVGVFAPVDPSYTEGHPPMELIGFKTSFAVFRHKKP